MISGLALAAVLAASQRFAEFGEFRAPTVEAAECARGFVWLEAEALADYGEWRLDTQFTHKMGSAYLLAPGVTKPIGEAKGRLRVPRAGMWRVWVRTKDWLPEFHPGRFTVALDGKRGRTLGAGGGTGWCWESAGDFDLAAGEHELSLVDLSGAFARCDALLLTTDLAYVPPDDPAANERERLRLTGADPTVAEGGDYDVVVVGAGTGGLGAAIAAARTGAKTALVHDRPVPGGNSSVELGIGTDGAAGSHPNRKLNSRETGLCEEANLMRGRTPSKTLSAAYRLMIAAEPNLTEAKNLRVVSVEKSGERIAAVIARDTLTGRRMRYRAKIFVDATGDGWVGVFAGAERMFGREAQAEFGEAPAPEKRDNLTMSGCLLGGALAYRTRRTGRDVAYRTPDWAKILPPGFDRNRSIRSIGPTWWIEHGGRFDDCADPERARDELVRISFAYWGWLKNESKFRDTPEARESELVWVPYMNGRREGYRLVGDCILTANDCLEGRVFPDRVTYGGWPLDTHDPLGIENPTGNGYWCRHPGVPEYTIPFRCLYSKNVPNLMMAGRCISVTHIALGSTRVEATIFTLGQAAGTAAALAVAKGLSPREYGRFHIVELQQRLLRDDQFIPGVVNEDPADLARGAEVAATSVATEEDSALFSRDLRQRDAAVHRLDHVRATRFARNGLARLDALTLRMSVEGTGPVPVRMKLLETDDAEAGPADAKLLAEWHGTARPGSQDVVFRGGEGVRLGGRFVWIVVGRTKGVGWFLRTKPVDMLARRAWSGGDRWQVLAHQQYDFIPEPMIRVCTDAKPEYVIDGLARPRGDCTHAWISDARCGLPQAVTLKFPKRVVAHEVRLVFDTDLTPTRVALYPKTLVRAYCVEGLVDGRWKVLASEDANDLRLRVHRFAAETVDALRVTVRKTHGSPAAIVNEIRVY